MDSTGMEEGQDIHAVQKKTVKCYNCGGPHYRSTCPLLSSNTGQKMRQKSRRKRSHRRERNQCKKVVSFAAENARTYLDVKIGGRSLNFLLDTGADITLISRPTWKRLGSPTLEPCVMPVKTADGSPMKIDGRFTTDFSIKDRTTGETIQGQGLCYVTESTNLLGLEWCIQLPAYKELKEKYDLYMLSNNNEMCMTFAGEEFRRNGLPLESTFRKLFLSHEMHLLKPGDAIFQETIREIGRLSGTPEAPVRADEMLFIDDSPANVEAALRNGMKAAHFRQGGDLRATLEQNLM